MFKRTNAGFIRILFLSFLFLKINFLFLTNFTGLRNYDTGFAIKKPQKMHGLHNFEGCMAIALPIRMLHLNWKLISILGNLDFNKFPFLII